MRFSSLVMAAAALVCLPTAAAFADSTTTFNFDGYYAVTAAGSNSAPVLQNVGLTGTITYDNTIGSITGASGFQVSLPTSSPSGNLTYSDSFGDANVTTLEGEWGYKLPLLDLFMPTNELTSGLGGSICSLSFPCLDNGYTVPASDILLNDRGANYAVYGTLTPQAAGGVAPTPEPASVSLLLTGIAGVATQLRRRRK